MYVNQESIFYYLTVMNEQYAMPAMPEGAHDGILKGMYRFSSTAKTGREGARAAVRQRRDPARSDQGAEILEAKYDVGADVWSVTSYGELYRDGHACERWNMLHPGRRAEGAVRHAVPEGRARRVRRGVRLREGAARLDRQVAAAPARRARHRRLRPQREPRQPARVLRSRLPLRRRRDAGALARDGKVAASVVEQAIKTHNINPEKANPAIS